MIRIALCQCKKFKPKREDSGQAVRTSSDVYGFPFPNTVRLRVARATEGAAPKRPAKLLGLKAAEHGEKGNHNSTGDESDKKFQAHSQVRRRPPLTQAITPVAIQPIQRR
jgi:hypothetical protein